MLAGNTRFKSERPIAADLVVNRRRLPVFVIGTRAQLIKVAPIVVACERHGLPLRILMTGQHRETMQDLIVEFGIGTVPIAALPATERATVGSLLRWVPAAYLGIRAKLREIKLEQPQIDVIVHGDTLSTVLGAFVGWRERARVVHIESGLTSGRLFDPFPEEIVRRIVFRLTSVAMCPSEVAAQHIRDRYRCEVVDTRGNTIVDAVALSGVESVASDQTPDYIVASLHRFQNIYDSARLSYLIGILEAVSAIYPVHFVLHPATRKRLVKEGLLGRLEALKNIVLSPRLGYSEFIRLAASAACVLTDGGSNQEELAVLGVPTVVMRNTTERPDGLGTNAVMEGDVHGSLQSYLLAGEFRSLQVPPSIRNGHSPSEVIARFLAGEATEQG